MCNLINVIEESFLLYVDYCYIGIFLSARSVMLQKNLFNCMLINVAEESSDVYID